jgi:hypothetical protein
MSCRAARSGCPPTARARFVHLAGRNGRCGSTPMETSVLMQCRWRGSADVIAADSPARSPISSLGGNNRSSDNSWSALERVPWCRSGHRGVVARGIGQDMSTLLKPGIRDAAIGVALVLTGCTVARDTSCKCPKPVAYDEATLKEISQALRALPSDNVLHRAMEDYENERDDLRFCP